MESPKRRTTNAKRKRKYAPRPLPKIRTPEELEQMNLVKRKKRRKKERMKVFFYSSSVIVISSFLPHFLGEKRMA